MLRFAIMWLLCLLPLPANRGFKLRHFLLRLAGIELADDVWVCGDCLVYGRGKVSIAEHSWLSPGTVFHTRREAAIAIGRHCDIGPGCMIVTGSHHIGPPHQRAGEVTALPVTIGDGCWIGARATILGGVTIGNGSMIAAGAVVAADVPDNVLAGGVPARVIRPLGPGGAEALATAGEV